MVMPAPAQSSEPKTAAAVPAAALSKKITLDTIGNALIYQGTAEEWARLLPVLKELDKPAKQVLIEVTIADVMLTDDEQFGIEWQIPRTQWGNYSGRIGTYDGLGLGGSGLTYMLTDSLGEVRSMLNAFASKKRINVLSSPRIVVKSGENASINIGTEVPILTSQSVDPAAPQQEGNTAILQQIQYRRTGVILQVKPTVHAGNRVDLEVSQEISKAEANTTSDISSPSILNRHIQTKLSLSDGGSVLLGGLISHSQNVGVGSVPILGDIPLLGYLFRVDKQFIERSELIVLIVPYILNNDQEAREITESFRRQLHIEEETKLDN